MEPRAPRCSDALRKRGGADVSFSVPIGGGTSFHGHRYRTRTTEHSWRWQRKGSEYRRTGSSQEREARTLGNERPRWREAGLAADRHIVTNHNT
ncbi:hypothetical protein HY479_00970 [Candidatus Uhrbacteria bacterium]|nr:hypothetical protein [Candidatus Uhrbacteria bacterium]